MITAAEMMELERTSGVPVHTLMENAGKAVASAIKEKQDVKDKKILIAAYHGNNGGDGFVAARHLCDDATVDVLFVGDEKKLKPEAAANYKRIDENVKVQFVDEEGVDFDEYDIIVDALLGTGTQGPLKPLLRKVIEGVNASKAFKVSIDIPSGINPDTGEVVDIAVNADLILCFHDIKAGLKGMEDKVEVVDIGIQK